MTHDNTTAEKPSSPSSPPRTRCARSSTACPTTVTLEDIQYHLDVVVKVLEAEASLGARRRHSPRRVRPAVRGQMARRIIWAPAARGRHRRDRALHRQHRFPGSRYVVVTNASRAAALRSIDFPYAARMIPEFQDPDRRETFVHEYRLMYRVEDDSHSHPPRRPRPAACSKNVPGSFEEARRRPTAQHEHRPPPTGPPTSSAR